MALITTCVGYKYLLFPQPKSHLPSPVFIDTLARFVTLVIDTLAFATIFMDGLCNLPHEFGKISEPKISPHSGAKASSQLSRKKGRASEKIGINLSRRCFGPRHFGEGTGAYRRRSVHRVMILRGFFGLYQLRSSISDIKDILCVLCCVTHLPHTSRRFTAITHEPPNCTIHIY